MTVGGVQNPPRAVGLRAASLAAVCCAIIGAPLCVWTLAAAVAEVGPDPLYQAVAAPLETSVPFFAVLASIALSVAGAVAGGVLARSSHRAGGTDRFAFAALLIGLVGVACVVAGALVILLGGFIIYGSS